MTSNDTKVCERLKRLGFAQDSRIKLYGQEFELLSDPLVISHDLVLIDAIEKSSRQQRRVRIPLSIVKIATEEDSAA